MHQNNRKGSESIPSLQSKYEAKGEEVWYGFVGALRDLIKLDVLVSTPLRLLKAMEMEVVDLSR